MQIRFIGDSVEIEGYVNAVERKSLPLWSRMGMFVERILKGAFARALKRADDVRILLNHDESRDLGGIKDGNLELTEDSIGLRAKTTIRDPEVVKKARNGELIGWSFGFFDRDVEMATDEDNIPLRMVRDLDLVEVSLLDRDCTPAYEGTLVTVRSSEGKALMLGEKLEGEVTYIDLPTEASEKQERSEQTEDEEPKQHENVENNINYDEWDKLITDMKKED